MRALWSQIPRPRVGGFPSISTHVTNDPAAAILVRKTTTAPIRRRLTFNDAFTLLLTPVLATAFVVDTSWKEKQRKDWDKKLADIQNEIDQLHARELRIRSSLRIHSMSGGLLRQQRHYSASAAPETSWEQLDSEGDEDEIEAPPWLQENDLIAEFENTKSSPSSTSDQPPPSDPESARSYSDQDMSAAHRYHRLVATMLAIRLITHFHVVTKGYLKQVPDDLIEDTRGTAGFPDVKDLPWLVEMNHKLKSELFSLRRAYPDLNGLGSQIDQFYHESPLHASILSLVNDFRNQKLDRYEFVQGYAKLVLSSKHVPCTQTYVSMLKALGRAGHDSLAYYVIAAFNSSKLPLTDEAVSHMLLSFGRARDSTQFDKFLRGVVQSRFPQHNLVGKWQLYMSKNGAIPVPENLNPFILQALIYMALRTKQTARAEVWCSFLEEMNFASPNASYLFSSFLHAYALGQHWDAGLLWLRRCVHYATLLASQSIDALSRVIFRMLDLCVACRRLPEYTTILDAAVNAGIPPPAAHRYRPSKFTPRARNILLEWKSLVVPSNELDLLTDRQRVRKFQKLCTLHKPDVSETLSETCQNSEDELVINPPNKKFFRYAVSKTDQPSSTHGDAIWDTTRSQLRYIQALSKQHQTEILSLKGQIELARKAIRPLQQDLDATQKREIDQRRLIVSLQNRLAESQTALESLPATLSSLKSMQAEIAAMKASLQGVPTTSPTNQTRPQQALAKEQDSTQTNMIRKQLAVEDSSPIRRVTAFRIVPIGSKVPRRNRQYSIDFNQNRRHALEYRAKQQPGVEKKGRLRFCHKYQRSSHSPPNPSLVQDDPPKFERNQNPSSQEDNNDPDLSRRDAPKADHSGSADLPDVFSDIQESLSRRGNYASGVDTLYRLDLSKVGHAIPGVKDSISTSSEAEKEETSHDSLPRVRRHYYRI